MQKPNKEGVREARRDVQILFEIEAALRAAGILTSWPQKAATKPAENGSNLPNCQNPIGFFLKNFGLSLALRALKNKFRVAMRG